MASDGNLARTGHALTLTSNDVELLESVRAILGIGNRLGRVRGGWGHGCYRLQWRDRRFHAWLTDIETCYKAMTRDIADRTHATKEPHARPAGGARRILRRFLPWVHRW